MLSAFSNELDNLKNSKKDIERRIKILEEVKMSLTQLGLTGKIWYEASLEDSKGFDFNLYKVPCELKYDRRWIGFPELDEYDHMQNYILPSHFEFKKEDAYEN